MEIFLHKYISLGIYSLGHISECRDSLLKNSQAKYFPGNTVKDLIPWDLLMPSIKGNGRTLTPSFYMSVQGEIITNLLSTICPKCFLATEVRGHISTEVFRKTGVKKLMETFIKILKVPRYFWKNTSILDSGKWPWLIHCNTGMRTCPLFNYSHSKFSNNLIHLYFCC